MTPGESDMISAGISGVSGIVGGLISQGYSDRNAERDFRLNEKAADNAADRERAMWDYTFSKTNLSAQRRMMEREGLSVGLMYGKNGTGQMAGAASTGNSKQGAGATYNRPNSVQDALNAALIGSQVKLNQSEAKKNEAEATFTEGAKTEETRASAGQKMQDMLKTIEETGNEKLKGIGMRLDNEIKTVEASFAEINSEVGLAKAMKELRYMDLEANRIIAVTEGQITSNDISSRSADSIVAQAAETVRLTQANAFKARWEGKLASEQIKYLDDYVNIGYINAEANTTSATAASSQAGAAWEGVGVRKDELEQSKAKLAFDKFRYALEAETPDQGMARLIQAIQYLKGNGKK